MKKRALKVAHNRPRPFYFTVQPRPRAHSPELIFHTMKSRDQTSLICGDIHSIFFHLALQNVNKDYVIFFVFSSTKVTKMKNEMTETYGIYVKYFLSFPQKKTDNLNTNLNLYKTQSPSVFNDLRKKL